MRNLMVLGLAFVGASTFGHYAVVHQTCKAVEEKALLKQFTISYRVGADKALLGIERVVTPGAKKYLDQDEWTGADVSEWKFERDYTRAYFRVSGSSGDLEVNLQSDDDGVGAMGFVNADGPIRVMFYRCPEFPFLN